MNTYTFKMATELFEFEQIFRLNYETFVEEIPQHEKNESRELIDKFHQENTYFICLNGKEVIGMIALRANRPFSLDSKLKNIDSYLPQGRHMCEIRLLSVKPEFRGRKIFYGLMEKVVKYGISKGYDLVLISGTVRKLDLYKQIGFKSFGTLVGTKDALYQPMYLTREVLEQNFPWLFNNKNSTEHLCVDLIKTSTARISPVATESRNINLLPGPVQIHPDIAAAFNALPFSHRSERYKQYLDETKTKLTQLTKAKHVELFLGSGTLANDVVAAQLSLLPGRGLVLSNGEFGDRLIDHADRSMLNFHIIKESWGDPLDYVRISLYLKQHNDIKWMWCVHCETSTGVLNDIEKLQALCREHNVLLCIDCISSIGTMPVSLNNIYLASGVSGKGLASYPGIAMVYFNHDVKPAPGTIPRYLDLGYYVSENGVPFTSSSNLIHALKVAVERVCLKGYLHRAMGISSWLRKRFRDRGFKLVAADDCAAPAVITVQFDTNIKSMDIGVELEKQGYVTHYHSEYLVKRNWIQICLMGEYRPVDFMPMLHFLENITHGNCFKFKNM